jgi:hypothetical protein
LLFLPLHARQLRLLVTIFEILPDADAGCPLARPTSESHIGDVVCPEE